MKLDNNDEEPRIESENPPFKIKQQQNHHKKYSPRINYNSFLGLPHSGWNNLVAYSCKTNFKSENAETCEMKQHSHGNEEKQGISTQTREKQTTKG